MKDQLRGVFLGVSIVCAGLIMRDAVLQFKKLGNTIEVRGLDERTVKSDQATWNIRYVVSADDIGALYGGASKTRDSIIGFLNERGFTTDEIQKTPLVISDRNTESYGGTNRATRFLGRATVMVSTKKVDLVTASAEVTDSLIEKGVLLEGSEVNYYFTGLNSIKPDMLKAASQAATAAAESLARDTGVKLGKIKQVSQGLFSITSPFSDAEYNASSSLMKQVRVVTRAEYSIE